MADFISRDGILADIQEDIDFKSLTLRDKDTNVPNKNDFIRREPNLDATKGDNHD